MAFQKIGTLALMILMISQATVGQDAQKLLDEVRKKLSIVDNYTAMGNMKTDVAFIKAPVGRIKVYYQKPDKFKLKRDGGISILPKGGLSLNIGNLLGNKSFQSVWGADAVLDGITVKTIKLIPNDDNNDVVLSTLYIDAAQNLVMKAATTTKESGSFEISMQYGKYIQYALPDKVLFTFNTKDYKMPKGVALEFDDEVKLTEAERLKRKKGKVWLNYSEYVINKGIPEDIFKK